ncbi:MAG: hypothetical protein OJF47_004308 [Nitrospira sp.]|nr:MAG: hypothetical protein OJF47_004308 [Nitrospira sp.]
MQLYGVRTGLCGKGDQSFGDRFIPFVIETDFGYNRHRIIEIFSK